VKKVILFLFLLPNVLKAQSQDKFQVHHDLFFDYIWSDRDSANFHLEQMQALAQKSKKPFQLGSTHNAQGTLHYFDGLYQEARDEFERGFDEARRAKDLVLQGKTIYNIGMCHHTEGDLERAKTSYMQAQKLFEEANDAYWMLNTTMNLAAILYNLKEFQDALSLYEDLEKQYVNMELLYEANNALMGKAGCQLMLKDYQSSLANYRTTLNNIDTTSDKHTHAFICQKMGLACLENSQFDEALDHVSTSMRIAQGMGYRNLMQQNYRYLGKIYHAIDRHDLSKQSYEKALELTDSLFNEEKQAQYALNDVRFNTALNMETIALQEALLQEKNRTILALVVAAVVLLTLLILLIWTYGKLKRNRLQLEKSLVEKDALLREIHHRVKNNLQVVSSLLNMHVRKVTDPKSKAILEEGADRVLAMSIIHKNLYQHTDLKTVSLDDYLFKLCNQLFDNYQASDTAVELKTELSPVSVDVDRLIPIGLIVNELISNAMKHAFHETQHAQIHVKLAQGLHNQIELEISDNGIGIDDAVNLQHSESIGMKLIRIFSQKLNSLVEISNHNGTRFKLSIPLG